MWLDVVTLLVTHLLVPAAFLHSVWRARDASRLVWTLKAASSGVYILYIALVGRWDWTSYYLRFVPAVLFVAAAIAGGRTIRGRPWSVRGSRRAQVEALAAGFVAALFLWLVALAAAGYRYPGEAVRLAFPLQDGTYYVAHGGDSPVLNYHNPYPAQRYALDILALDGMGRRARGLAPADLDRYVIFGATVHSPCDGVVHAAVDGLPDQTPPRADREHAAGNHVIVACRGVHVELAHLRNGSVRVRPGMAIATGQPLGQVGNSGNTSEPHLHIHATRAAADDEGVPMLLDDRFPVRNTVFVE